MATETRNRRRRSLLAVLLALIAAGALCVLGAAAAGYTISFPILDAFIDAISVSPEERAARDAQGGDAAIPAAGAGGSEDAAADEANCLLGLLCINASAAGSVDGGDSLAANVSTTSNKRCFLDLVCFTANSSAATGGFWDGAIDANTNVDGEGIEADLEANGENCLLGLICLNANLDASANSGAYASLANALSDWWNSLAGLFVRIEANG